MLNFSVDYDLDSAIEVLVDLRTKIENPLDFLDLIGSKLLASSEERFDTATDPEGFSWANLSPLTRDRKEQGYKDKPLLTSNADLARSLLYEVEESSVIVGSSSDYAKYHQSIKPRKKLPRRAFLGVSRADEGSIREALNEFLQGER